MNIYHKLRDPQDTINLKDIDDFELTDEQNLAIKKALADLRFLKSNAYREQVFRLCSLLHGQLFHITQSILYLLNHEPMVQKLMNLERIYSNQMYLINHSYY